MNTHTVDPSKEIHIMVDIETLGTKPGCKILSIGACSMFHAEGEARSVFEVGISIAGQEKFGLFTDPDTLEWWKDKPAEVRAEAFGGTELLSNALLKFAVFLQELVDAHSSCWSEGSDVISPQCYIWAKSPSFDCAILSHTYKLLGIPNPWRFRNERDVRTAMCMAGIDPVDPATVEHTALADALAQAALVETAYRRLGLV